MINVTSSPYSAVSGTDCTAAFTHAVSDLVSGGGGTLYIPPGNYMLSSQLNFGTSSANCPYPIVIRGESSATSVLVVDHSNTVLSFYPTIASAVEVHEIGMQPMQNGGVAIAVNGPLNGSSGWETCRVENVDFTRPGSGGTFSGILHLANIWRSRFRNLDVNGGSAVSYFASISGFSIDNVFDNVICANVLTGWAINSSTLLEGSQVAVQGLHISNCVFASGNTALDTSAGPAGSAPINVLGLYINGCEFDCSATALMLYQINGGYITNSHFSTLGSACVVFTGCGYFHMNDCSLSGGGGSGSVGATFNASTYSYCTMNQLQNCEFIGFSTQLSFGGQVGGGPSVGNNIALGCAFTSGSGVPSLINSPTIVNKGTGTNQVEWVTTSGGTGRFGYLH